MSEPRVFIAVPTYDGKLLSRAAQTIYTPGGSTRNPKMQLVNQNSLLCYGFNSLWCTALNLRHQGITHFAMLHSDIIPDDDWVDALLEEMDANDADIVSAVVPLKSSAGVTSTAVMPPGSESWTPRRLTIRESGNLPQTFSASDVPWSDGGTLLVNTGCWICKFTDPWVERVCFTILDAIDKNADGIFEPSVFPEDWNFSMFAAKEDLKVVATTRVRLNHIGMAPFPNHGTWGQMVDEANIQKQEQNGTDRN